MKSIEIKDGYVFYYGSPAGYVSEETAVLDNMFKSGELEGWITKRGFAPKWQDGVYDRLADGGPVNAGETPLKACRIWQLKPEADVMMKFIGYEELAAKFGEPDCENYTLVYDGQPGTNDLDEIWTKLNDDARPPGYEGRSLSMSDVIELYDHNGSEFHYVDRFGFRQTGFNGQAQQGQNMAMNM